MAFILTHIMKTKNNVFNEIFVVVMQPTVKYLVKNGTTLSLR